MSGAISLPVISKFDPSGIKQAQSALDGFKGAVGKIAGAVAVAFSVGAITNFAKEAIKAAEGVQVANSRIEAIAKATQVFGSETQNVTSRLIKLAEAQELRLGVDAEVIKGVQGQLLSFKQLSESADTAGGTFDRVTEAAFNMAAAGFGSAESNAVALGKAFEDPVKGLTALRRSGTVFTEEQQNLIKSLVDTGDVAAAQEVILRELETQYGGVAAATATASDKFAILFDNIKESVGAELLPIFEDLFTEMQPILTEFASILGDTFKQLAPTFSQLVPVIGSLFTAFMPLLPVIG
jgi:phage-related minor tail protein